MARMLYEMEVYRLAVRPGVSKAAVVEFMQDADNSMPLEFHLRNLAQDAKEYGWNRETVAAIRDGLKLSYKEAK